MLKTTFLDFQIINPGDRQQINALQQGANRKGIVILYHTPEDPEEQETFLAKILKAVQLDLQQDTLYINKPPAQPLNVSDILSSEQPQTILIFGIPLPEIGVHFSLVPYQIVQHQEHRFLLADALPKIFEERQQGGKNRSAQLWKALQQLFPEP